MDADEQLLCLSILSEDPARAFAASDADTRSDYLREVEHLSHRCGAAPSAIAVAAIELSRQTRHSQPMLTHVGYFLIGAGRASLEQKIGVVASLPERARRALRRHIRGCFMYGVIALAAFAMLALRSALAQRGTALIALFLTLLIASPVALRMAADLLRALLGRIHSPRRFPRFDFRDGIPDAFRTAVVIPVIVSRREDVEQAIDTLEQNFRSCPVENLLFCLLTDFSDATAQVSAADELLDRALDAAIARLNADYAAPARPRFFRLHRERVFSAEQGVWWGWERKRGKLLEFCRFAKGQPSSLEVAPSQWQQLTFAIVLDVNSCASPGALLRMVEIMAFPTQMPQVHMRRVVRGYGMIRPTLIATACSARSSFFKWMFAPYVSTQATTVLRPSFYQDVFDEDLYGGQGGFHIEAFLCCVDGRLPQNAILSHDHLEGMLCAVGYASDVTFADDFPTSFSAWRQRQHRWVRGDCQTVPWLLPIVRNEAGARERNPLQALDRWKIMYTMLGHVYPICLLLIACASWCGMYGERGAIAWIALATMQFAGLLGSAVRLFSPALHARCGYRGFRFLLREAAERLRSAMVSLQLVARSWLLSLVLLLDCVVVSADALIRASYRLTISRRRLLEWKSAATAQFELTRASVYQQLQPMWAAVVLTVLIGMLVAALEPQNLFSAMPALVAWLAAPWIGYFFLGDRRAEQARPQHCNV